MDPSKIAYCCTRCQQLPCRCIRDSSRVTFQILQCSAPHCNYTTYTATDLQNHHLAAHERPYIFIADQSVVEHTNGGAKHDGTHV